MTTVARREFPARLWFVRSAAYGIGDNIIDIGCSIGNTFGERAINVDSRSHEEIREDARSFHGEITIPNFIQADASHLPFKDGSFDVAVLSEILEHVEDPVAALNEAQRIATFVIISVPNEYEWKDAEKQMAENPSGHLHHFTKSSFVSMLNASGLQIIELLDWLYVGWAYFIAIGMSKDCKMVSEA